MRRAGVLWGGEGDRGCRGDGAQPSPGAALLNPGGRRVSVGPDDRA